MADMNLIEIIYGELAERGYGVRLEYQYWHHLAVPCSIYIGREEADFIITIDGDDLIYYSFFPQIRGRISLHNHHFIDDLTRVLDQY